MTDKTTRTRTHRSPSELFEYRLDNVRKALAGVAQPILMVRGVSGGQEALKALGDAELAVERIGRVMGFAPPEMPDDLAATFDEIPNTDPTQNP